MKNRQLRLGIFICTSSVRMYIPSFMLLRVPNDHPGIMSERRRSCRASGLVYTLMLEIM